MENYCERAAEIRSAGGGLGRDGGMAEFMLIPSARLLVPLEDLDPRQAAPLSDAALTPYHAIKRSLPLLSPGTSAVIIGVGGLGHLAVQILKALSPARVIAVDVAQDKLGLARESGADEVVLSNHQAAEAIRELTHGQGADVVLDFVGVDATLALSAKVVRVLGHLSIVGLAGGSLRWDFFALPNGSQLTGPYWGSITELMEVVDLARAGKIQIHTEFFPLESAMGAYERLRSGTLRGRAVITPHDRPG
jgi:alcohol dehydrogenase, propanol-preferring